MRLLDLHLQSFRNIAAADLSLHPLSTVFYGDNGHGKTNLLEAIYVLGMLRSFRANRPAEMIRFGDARALLRGRAERRGLTSLLEVRIDPRGRQARVDGKLVSSAAEYFGGLSVVLFAPEHLSLVKGPPHGRRQFLDRAIFSLDRGYLGLAQDYAKTVRHRNAVLRDRPRDVAGLLDAYDAQLARLGSVIARRRAEAAGDLDRFVQAAWAGIVQRPLALGLRYETASLDEGALAAALAGARAKDLARGFTGAGPHGDDLLLDLDGRLAALHASQGQIRALVLALKLGEIERLRARVGDPPILLLDDVSSELDAARTRQLFEQVAAMGCQTLVTTTQPKNLPDNQDRSYFQMIEGTPRPAVLLAGDPPAW